MAQDSILPAFRSNLRNLSSSHGEGNAGGEGDEGHEAREHDREGQEGPDKRLPWQQDEDLHRADQGQPDEEQEREDREQEGEREREEGLRQDQGLDLAVTKARKALAVKGFLAIKKGTPLYKKAKEFYGKLARNGVMLGGEDARSSGMWGSPA